VTVSRDKAMDLFLQIGVHGVVHTQPNIDTQPAPDVSDPVEILDRVHHDPLIPVSKTKFLRGLNYLRQTVNVADNEETLAVPLWKFRNIILSLEKMEKVS